MKKNTAPAPEALLTPLQELIDHCVNTGLFMTTAGPKMTEIKNQFEVDSERLKQGLVKIRLLPQAKRMHGVRVLQQKLADLMDVVHAHVGSDRLAIAQESWWMTARTVGSELYIGLEGLLLYIEHHCPKQFDYDIPLCKSQREVWQVTMDNQRGVVYRWFEAVQFSTALYDYVMEPFHEIVQPKYQPLLSFREWMYRKKLLDKLVEAATSRPVHAEEALLHVLVRHNFNHDAYIDYCTDYLDAELMRSDLTYEERMARIQYYRKFIKNARPTAKGVALRPRHDALHKRLIVCIDAARAIPDGTIDLLRKKEHVPQGDRPRKQRLATTPSGPESAGLLRALVECDFFDEENYAEIVRHYAYGFSTPGTDAPKVKHVREDFDNLSETAYRYIESLSRKMIQLVADLRSGKRILRKRR